MEVPSCERCNKGTRLTDAAVALLSRVYPNSGDELDRKEIEKHLKAAHRNLPGLLQEWWIGPAGQALLRSETGISEGGGLLRANGPITTAVMQSFATKMALALYFDKAREPLPVEGYVLPFWHSNVQAIQNELPNELIRLLPEPQTLRAGQKEVSRQFNYSSQLDEEAGFGAVFATFRQSFAISAFFGTDRNTVPAEISQEDLISPRDEWGDAAIIPLLRVTA